MKASKIHVNNPDCYCFALKKFIKIHGYGYQSALVKRSTFSYVCSCYCALISHLVTSDSVRGFGLWLGD